MLRFSILTIAVSVALQLTSQQVKAQPVPGETGPAQAISKAAPGETGPINNDAILGQDEWSAQEVPGETGPVSPAPSPSPD